MFRRPTGRCPIRKVKLPLNRVVCGNDERQQLAEKSHLPHHFISMNQGNKPLPPPINHQMIGPRFRRPNLAGPAEDLAHRGVGLR